MNVKAQHSQGLLLFSLHNGREFALGTLKIRELVPYTPITSIMNAEEGLRGTGVRIIGDGGIKYTGDIGKAICAGADEDMIHRHLG